MKLISKRDQHLGFVKSLPSVALTRRVYVAQRSLFSDAGHGSWPDKSASLCRSGRAMGLTSANIQQASAAQFLVGRSIPRHKTQLTLQPLGLPEASRGQAGNLKAESEQFIDLCPHLDLARSFPVAYPAMSPAVRRQSLGYFSTTACMGLRTCYVWRC